MKHRIVIEVDERDSGDLDLFVDVSAQLNVMEAIGLMEMAKEQHRDSKLIPGSSVLPKPDSE